jgi:hypothetical protein
MRVVMGVIRGPNGIFYASKNVPDHLREAVARVTDAKAARVSWLTSADARLWAQRIAEDETRGRKLKTASLRRVVPVHPQSFHFKALFSNLLERFPKGVTRLSDKKRDQAKNRDPFPIHPNREWI